MHCAVLREYLQHSLITEVPFGFDIDHAIDDWVFTCFLVGNDFLPHLPTLDIREGAIDLLTALYKRLLPRMGGYMTENGTVIVERALILIDELASMEDDILLRRLDNEDKRAERAAHQQIQDHRGTPPEEAKDPTLPQPESRIPISQPIPAETSMMSAKGLQASLTAANQPFPQSPPRRSSRNGAPPEDQDTVRLGEFGWRDRYYKYKFDKDMEDHQFFKEICESYMTGLCWVMLYYLQGCRSWQVVDFEYIYLI